MNANRAYELIKERTASLELDLWMHTNEISLVRQRGMTREAVSEAVGRLISEGWLERTRRGIKMTEDALASVFGQLFEVRSVLEELCERQSALSTACVDKRKCWLTVKSAEYSLQALAETLANNYSGNAM